jgi:uncharacterized protein DUF4385
LFYKNFKNDDEMNTNSFDYSPDFKKINFREHPELYRIGKGEQGVLLVEPYRSEILPYWRFKTEAIAKKSAEKIYSMFEEYLKNDDFIGADISRKYLQMGFTRARRYANHKSGRKYEKEDPDRTAGLAYPYSSGSRNKGNKILKQERDALNNEKAKAADIFKHYWFMAKDHPRYQKQKTEFKNKFYP